MPMLNQYLFALAAAGKHFFYHCREHFDQRIMRER
jgi:hypothetical protein